MTEHSNWDWCAECDAYHPVGQHFPLWLVWEADPAESIDDALKIRACNAEVAAMRWAERSDRESGDWSIVHGGDLETACVVLEERRLTEEPTLYHVWGESVPKYHATRKE